MNNLFEVKENKSRIVVGIEMTMTWQDDRLHFTSEESKYMDVTEFLPRIWRPKFRMVPVYDVIY